MTTDRWPRRQVVVVAALALAGVRAASAQSAWTDRPGASGNIGAAAVAKAPADGSTLLMGVNTLVNMTYDPLKDLTPIGLCATGSFLLVAGMASGLRSVDPLVKQARARPGSLDDASPGIATPNFMAMELFKLRAKISITHIPSSATAGAVSAVLAGDVPLWRRRCRA